VNKVAIVDYGLCNLDSVARAVEECGGTATVTDQERDIEIATHIILPGVGAFGDAMRNIHRAHLDEIMAEQVIEKQIPFLGICLGMQLMATTGWENGENSGLGWISSDVQRLQPTEQDKRIPHIGWNEVVFDRESSLFRGVPPTTNFYFVHSYHLVCQNPRDVLAHTPYCGDFTSAISRDWLFGVQFHPEKSQKWGFQVLKNFLSF
jgi:glutamine amidotransferase